VALIDGVIFAIAGVCAVENGGKWGENGNKGKMGENGDKSVISQISVV